MARKGSEPKDPSGKVKVITTKSVMVAINDSIGLETG
jgi:hypothetical protein